MPASSMNSSAQQTVWAKRAIVESYKQDTKLKGLFGEAKYGIPETGKPFILRKDLQKNDGDNARVQMIIDLNGEGVNGDATLEGNEEEIGNYNFTITVNQKRNAVKNVGRMDEQKSPIVLQKHFSSRLTNWYKKVRTREIIRKLAGLTTYTFSNTPTAATTNRVLYGGDATATNNIDSSDKLTPALITKACVLAKNDRITGTDSKPVPSIAPINFGSDEAYLLLVHPEVFYDLFRDSEFQQVLREAEKRGKENPLFRSGDLYYNGCVIREIDELREAEVANWGSGADQPGATSLFLGSSALFMCETSQPDMVNKMFDYDNQTGMSIGNIWGLQKAKYNGEDLATIALKTYRTSL